MQEDLLTINEKFDPRISGLEDKLSELKLRKQQAREKVVRYYKAIEMKQEAELIINEGKPTV